MTQYRVQGTSLLADGKPITFHGVNLTGLELSQGHLQGMWTKLTFKDYLTSIKAQGFNGLRIPITSSTLRGVTVPNSSSVGWYPPNDYLKGMDSRQMLKALVDEIEASQLRYVFDWHYLEAGIRPGSSIPALWYTDRYTDQDWINDLVDLATLFKGRPGFVSIDTKNEPDSARDGWKGCTWGDGNQATDWKLANERAFQAINRVNQDIILTIEWLGQGSGLDYMVNQPPNIPRDRYCLSCHIYGPGVWDYEPYASLYANSNYPFNMRAHWARQFLDVAKKELVFVGEYGSLYDTGRQKAWLDELVKAMVEAGVTFSAYWEWGSDSAGSGGILADSGYRNIRQDKVAAIAPMGKVLPKTTDPVVVKPPVVIPPVVTPTVPDDDIDLTRPTIPAPVARGDQIELVIGKASISALVIEIKDGFVIAGYVAKDGIVRETRIPFEVF